MESVHLDSYQRHGNVCCRHFAFKGVQTGACHPHRHECTDERRITGEIDDLVGTRAAREPGRIFLAWPLDQDLAGLPFIRQVGSQGNALLHVQQAIKATLLDLVWDLVWQAWRHVLGAPVEYGGIYLRDGYCCRSPVCSRRDVTPHHLRFRSQGGGDEPDNVASVCSWCHLFGIHGGRIRAHGSADCIHWELGPVGRPCVVVHGRDRVAA